MLGEKEFTGIVLDNDLLRVARLKVQGKKLHLVKLDKYSLAEPIKETVREPEHAFDTAGGSETEDEDSDSIFGLDDDDLEGALEDTTEDDDLSFDDFEDEPSEENDAMSLDMVEETDQAQTNEIVLHNILTSLDTKKARIGVNIPAGETIFQVLRDTDFNQVKRKDLIQNLEEKLESIYGVQKTSDNYAYEVREDGSVLLASLEDEPPLLRIFDRTRDIYSGKLQIEEVFPDEVILSGLVRANYEMPEDEITGILQFGETRCRIVFLKGKEILQVSPIINEGTQSRNFLNTIFSKILFQLDSGEVPNLNRLIIANNTQGGSAIDFFKKNFPDIKVGEFRFDEDKFDPGDQDRESVRAFTTAIGMAWAAAGVDKAFPPLSLIPDYVIDQQKIFSLHWHGVLLLVLIFVAPLTFNYFYQNNVIQIENLHDSIAQTNSQLEQIAPTVADVEELEVELAEIQEDLVLLDTLSQGSREWSAKLSMVNEGIQNIRGVWFTNLNNDGDVVRLEGYSLYRARIPRVVDVFDNATLLDVQIDEIRDREVFRFVMEVSDFASDEDIYSPPRPDELDEFLSN